MSNNNQDWLDDDEFDLDDVFEEDDKPSRRGANDNDALRKVRRAERAKDKQLKELQVELESLRKFRRESTISQVLQENNVNPKIAAFIPGDIEVSQESINAWLEQHGDIFGVQQVQQKTQAEEMDLSALRQIDAATSGAYSPDDVNDLYSVLNNAQSQEELLNLLYSQGME